MQENKSNANSSVNLGPNQLFINGNWEDSSGGEVIAVECPANKKIICSVPRGNSEDVNKAVNAAENAFSPCNNNGSTGGAALNILESCRYFRTAHGRGGSQDKSADCHRISSGQLTESDRGVFCGTWNVATLQGGKKRRDILIRNDGLSCR